MKHVWDICKSNETAQFLKSCAKHQISLSRPNPDNLIEITSFCIENPFSNECVDLQERFKCLHVELLEKSQAEYESAWLDSISQRVHSDLRQLEIQVANKSMNNFINMNTALILIQIKNLISIRDEIVGAQNDINESEQFTQINQKIDKLTELSDCVADAIENKKIEYVRLLNMKLDRLLTEAMAELNNLQLQLAKTDSNLKNVQKQCFSNGVSNVTGVVSSTYELSRSYKKLSRRNLTLGVLTFLFYGAMSLANLYFYKEAGDKLNELKLVQCRLDELKTKLKLIDIEHMEVIDLLLKNY